MSGYRYRVCGLSVDSDFALDEAVPGEPGPPDLSIRRGAVRTADVPDDGFRSYSITADGDLIEYRGIGRFLVVDGATVVVDVEPEFDLRLMGLPLLGPVFALILHRRKRYVLHGSAVEIAGEAHVFLGDKGTGKSTTAASLIAAGHRLIADDVVALESMPGGGLAIFSGFPAMKLDRPMLDRFAPGTYRLIEPESCIYTGGKLRVRLNQDMIPKPIPLGRVHRLTRGSANAITRFNAIETLHALVRFSHYPRFGAAANAPTESAALFSLASSLAPRIRAGMLTVKDSLEEISAVGPFLMRETALADARA